MWDTAGEVKKNSWATFFYGPLHTDMHVLADKQELIYNSSVQTADVVSKTSPKRWKIETKGERERERDRERVREICACNVTWWWWWWWSIYFTQSAGAVEWLHLCKGVKLPLQRVFWIWHWIASDREALRTRSTPSLPLHPDRLWPGVVAPDRFLSIGQRKLLNYWTVCKMTYAKLNC